MNRKICALLLGLLLPACALAVTEGVVEDASEQPVDGTRMVQEEYLWLPDAQHGEDGWMLTAEERERYEELAGLIERGMLDVNSMLEGESAENEERDGQRPRRRLTDEELCMLLIKDGVRDRSKEIDTSEVERRAREVLCERFGCPLSMKLDCLLCDGCYVLPVFDASGEKREAGEPQECYGATFIYNDADGVQVCAQAMFDRKSGELVSAETTHIRDWEANPGPSVMCVTEEDVCTALVKTQTRLGLGVLDWHILEGEWLTDWNACRAARAEIGDEFWLTVFVGGDDGRERGLTLERGMTMETLPDNKEQ